jgi:hypothetical protein
MIKLYFNLESYTIIVTKHDDHIKCPITKAVANNVIDEDDSISNLDVDELLDMVYETHNKVKSIEDYQRVPVKRERIKQANKLVTLQELAEIVR